MAVVENYTTKVSADRTSGEIQVMLPYMVTEADRTVWDDYVSTRLAITQDR